MEAQQTTGTGSRSPLAVAAEKIGELDGLDAVAGPLGETVRRLIGTGVAKDVLSGAFLGHALHPLLTDVPIGTWTSAMILDFIGGEGSEDAAQRLIGIGILAAFPTLWSGWSDWSDAEEQSPAARRIGIVHAAANGAALALFARSYGARRKGDRRRGVALGLAAGGALGLGGFLGGHLSYAEGVGVEGRVAGDA